MTAIPRASSVTRATSICGVADCLYEIGNMVDLAFDIPTNIGTQPTVLNGNYRFNFIGDPRSERFRFGKMLRFEVVSIGNRPQPGCPWIISVRLARQYN